MSTMYAVSWDQHEERLASIDEVEDLLDRLHDRFKNGDPTLVSIALATRDSLSIGLGRDASVLNHVREDRNPPYYISTGGGGETEGIWFRFGGEWSEYPTRNAVPISVARAVMRQFCKTGKLPQSIEWEEV
jgi:hypothetical protein